jgi:hypothetical protein
MISGVMGLTAAVIRIALGAGVGFYQLEVARQVLEELGHEPLEIAVGGQVLFCLVGSSDSFCHCGYAAFLGICSGDACGKVRRGRRQHQD